MAPGPVGPILLIDFECARAGALAEQLRIDGFCVCHASTPEHARVLSCSAPPSLVLVCAGASSRRALELLCELRDSGLASWAGEPPAILLGAGSAEVDVMRAFEAGADDYLSSAGSYLELRARVRALLNRPRRCPHTRRIEVRSLVIDTVAHTSTLGGVSLALRPMEFALLEALAREPRRVFTKRELLASVWRYRAPGATRTVDTHASRLRRKLAGDGSAELPRWVITVWGVGYRLI